jgi:hypothetical protein
MSIPLANARCPHAVSYLRRVAAILPDGLGRFCLCAFSQGQRQAEVHISAQLTYSFSLANFNFPYDAFARQGRSIASSDGFSRAENPGAATSFRLDCLNRWAATLGFDRLRSNGAERIKPCMKKFTHRKAGLVSRSL